MKNLRPAPLNAESPALRVDRSSRPGRRGPGFTLVELLTVIAIVTILAALLFPVFARAREKARLATCASNQRQIGMAFAQYTQDYDEVLPPHSYGRGFQGWAGYGNGDGMRWADMLQPYLRSRSVLDCPSAARKAAELGGGAYLDVRTYSYGYSTPVLDVLPDSLYGVAGQALARIEETSATVMLADDDGPGEHRAHIDPDPLDVPATLAFKLDGLRHSSAAEGDYGQYAFNALYVDGHVRFVRLPDTLGGALRQWRVAGD